MIEFRIIVAIKEELIFSSTKQRRPSILARAVFPAKSIMLEIEFSASYVCPFKDFVYAA